MKAKDVGFVSETLGNIKTLLNDLASNEKLDKVDDKSFITFLEETRDKIGKVKDSLDSKVIKAGVRRRKRTP